MGIVIVGGFATPRAVFTILQRRVRHAGQHHTAVFTHHLGLDCSEATYTAFNRFLRAFNNTCDEPSTIIAYSRGGQLAKVTAVRAPGYVHAVVTLGAPFAPGVDHLGTSTRRKILTLGKLGAIGIPGVVSTRCLAENGCCQHFWDDLSRPWPTTVHVRTIYARADTTVQPRTSDHDITHPPIWVDGSHYQLLAPEAQKLTVSETVRLATAAKRGSSTRTIRDRRNRAATHIAYPDNEAPNHISD